MRTLAALLLALIASSLPATEPVAATVADLGWMAGNWRMESDETVVEEGWLAPSGGTMLGVNRTVGSDRTIAFEYLRLNQDESNVVLLASPNGRCPATRFRLVTLDDQKAVFANPDHDFPQRIIYHRDGNSLLTAIEGSTDDGEYRRSEWVLELMP